jgi:ribosomal protein S18 acetylase RimI-like enzyme
MVCSYNYLVSKFSGDKDNLMEIRRVQNNADLKAFVDLPYRLYRHDPLWVPPLRSEQMGQFDPRRNPMLDHCQTALFLLEDQGRVIGRISAFTDRLALEHWHQQIGLFGSYECIDSIEASRLLLGAACEWLRGEGMQAMRGPWSFASQEWGCVVEGFQPAPVILAPYNPPYYNDHLAAFGLDKAKDLLVYYIDVSQGYIVPERILKLTEQVQKRYKVRVRPVNMKNLEAEVQTIVRLANISLADNWGYYPVTQAEAAAMARDMKQIVQPRALLIAETVQGQPVGFAMSLPDVNLLLKGMHGSLLPFGWLKLLLGIPRLNQYRMWALGVIPEYQGRAIDSLLYKATYDAIYNDKIRLEINYVLEDNDRMNNAVVKMGATLLRRYRVYQMAL